MQILIVRNNTNSQALDASMMLVAYLNSMGIGYDLLDSEKFFGMTYGCCSANTSEDNYKNIMSRNWDMIVSLGGDGTLLRSSHIASNRGIPIMGVNFGNLGFLTNKVQGVVDLLCRALSDELMCQNRSNLDVFCVCEGDNEDMVPFSVSNGYEENDFIDNFTCDEDGAMRRFFALNELVLGRAENGRIVDFSFAISGTKMCDVRGDGLVVSTATGSTAYALSVGGPVVSPGFGGLVVVPIAPHSLRTRAVLTSANDVVEITPTKAQQELGVHLFVDGVSLKFDAPVKKVYVRKGLCDTKLLAQEDDFYKKCAEVFF